jgi:hypothetical protein
MLPVRGLLLFCHEAYPGAAIMHTLQDLVNVGGSKRTIPDRLQPIIWGVLCEFTGIVFCRDFLSDRLLVRLPSNMLLASNRVTITCLYVPG